MASQLPWTVERMTSHVPQVALEEISDKESSNEDVDDVESSVEDTILKVSIQMINIVNMCRNQR